MNGVDLPPFRGEAVSFEALSGFERDDLAEAFAAFRRSAEAIVSNAALLRPARPAFDGLEEICRAALSEPEEPADFFRRRFQPFRLEKTGLLTGYYEVEVEARRKPEPGFATPVLARPGDLVTLNEAPLMIQGGPPLYAAQRRDDGALEPYAPRREIEEGPWISQSPPLAYLADAVELFLIQVQGSARLVFPDGSSAALTYDGRNGRPYTSIGQLLIECGLVQPERMSLAVLKATLRALGAGPGEPGRRLMQKNESYVFFRQDDSPERSLGPIGGAGLALSPLRSIAVDRSIWCYGLPFWIEARIPWRSHDAEDFARLMVAQDTGSAILGETRADLYFGSGEKAGALAGGIRHDAQFFTLLPKVE
ncbi:murein transglycosylase A [Methylocystis bryophila]|uniref:peptidoglycan lytic exotransglycosylase n=1 Tax=Methylocystis bryophila TaxID=655015 RepID=A0A1W6MXQ0_9HYPH|nr:MltA domain-containing protein [Methylocystis bryophila]ARN82375.1 transglycosylase [Methylocystis bryophila]BDV38543.1 transglycosylase [Methylocystis bryophila]